MTLDELQKLCDEATPGPWDPVGAFARQEGYGLHLDLTVVTPGRLNVGRGDSDFVAAARTYLPKLLAVARAAISSNHHWNEFGPEHDFDQEMGWLHDAIADLSLLGISPVPD